MKRTPIPAFTAAVACGSIRKLPSSALFSQRRELLREREIDRRYVLELMPANFAASLSSDSEVTPWPRSPCAFP
jgi:hypothetical protein